MDKPKVLFGALLVHAWVRSSHTHECASQPNYTHTHTHAVYNDNSNAKDAIRTMSCSPLDASSVIPVGIPIFSTFTTSGLQNTTA